MSGYRVGSKWNDINEMRCLLAFILLKQKNFPRNMLSELAEGIAKISGLGAGSVKAKIGNFKSVAGITGHSNASKKTLDIYHKYSGYSTDQLKEEISKLSSQYIVMSLSFR